METVLAIKNLHTTFKLGNNDLNVVRGVTLDVRRGKTLVILGESGSGKSVLLKSILRLLDSKKSAISGSIKYNNRNLLELSEGEMSRIRGNGISMIFQNALTALDPVYKVGRQIEEVLEQHKVMNTEKRGYAVKSLRNVGIPSPEERAMSYPHELSGGMRQRAVIAMSLTCNPDILLADEPTTALDVTIQSQVLHLFKQIQEEHGTTIILVTHDIGVAASIADEIAVMYAGNIVEYGTAEDILYSPQHPYTKGLIDATPKKGEKLIPIPGEPPSLLYKSKGCDFAPRCSSSSSICSARTPEVITGESRFVYCHHSLSCLLYTSDAADE